MTVVAVMETHRLQVDQVVDMPTLDDDQGVFCPDSHHPLLRWRPQPKTHIKIIPISP